MGFRMVSFKCYIHFCFVSDRTLDMAEIVKKRSRDQPSVVIGNCVSIQPTFFGEDYAKSLPDMMNKLYGRIEHIHDKKMVTVRWDIDGTTTMCNMNLLTVESNDQPVQFIVEMCGSHAAASSHALLVENNLEESLTIDENEISEIASAVLIGGEDEESMSSDDEYVKQLLEKNHEKSSENVNSCC